MHSGTRVWQFEVQIFVNVTSGMGEIVGEVIGVHVVVVDITTTVLTFRLEVEPDIVPVGGPNFVVWVLSVSEIFGKGKRKGSGF